MVDEIVLNKMRVDGRTIYKCDITNRLEMYIREKRFGEIFLVKDSFMIAIKIKGRSIGNIYFDDNKNITKINIDFKNAPCFYLVDRYNINLLVEGYIGTHIIINNN
jgi:hypothetical protein